MTLERREPMKRGKGPRRDGPGARRFADAPRKPLPRGRRRSVRKIAPDVCADVEARSGGVCEAYGLRGGPGRCRRRAVLFHHRWRQGQGGPESFDNLLHLCGLCHWDVHHLGGRAYALGLLIRSGDPVTPYVPQV